MENKRSVEHWEPIHEDETPKVRGPISKLLRDKDAAIEQRDAVIRELVEAGSGATASLVAAVSLLSRGGRKTAPSDKMFKQMLADYTKAIDTARTALARAKEMVNDG